MRAADFLAAAERLPVGTLDELTGGRGIVVLAPHPDDESLGCGGLIALACGRGVPVRLVVVSDGAGSHPNSVRYPPVRLRALREEETRVAAAALGLQAEAITFLRLPDRAVPSAGPDADTAVAAIEAAIRTCGAGALLATWAHDPHCDHEATAALARLALGRCPDVKAFAYPVWGWALPADAEVGPAPRGLRLDVSDQTAAKAAAIAAHRSQLTDLIDDDPDGFRLEPTVLARFAGRHEIFLEMSR